MILFLKQTLVYKRVLDLGKPGLSCSQGKDRPQSKMFSLQQVICMTFIMSKSIILGLRYNKL